MLLHRDVRHVEKESNRGDTRAACINLHPLQFDPDHKVQVMGGYERVTIEATHWLLAWVTIQKRKPTP